MIFRIDAGLCCTARAIFLVQIDLAEYRIPRPLELMEYDTEMAVKVIMTKIPLKQIQEGDPGPMPEFRYHFAEEF